MRAHVCVCIVLWIAMNLLTMFPPAKVYCYCLVQELKASYAWHIPDPSVHWCFLHMVDSGIITNMHSHLCIHIYVVCRFYKYIHLCYDQPVYVYPSLFHVESSNLRTCMPKMYKPITLMPHTHGLPCFAHVLHVLPTAYLFYDSSSWLALPLILLSMDGRYWSYYLYTLKSMFPPKKRPYALVLAVLYLSLYPYDSILKLIWQNDMGCFGDKHS